MVDYVDLVSVIGRTDTGKSKPLICQCEDKMGNFLSLIVKTCKMPDAGLVGLVRELIAYKLAKSVDIEIPEAFLVKIDNRIIASIPDEYRSTLVGCNPVAFGSKIVIPNSGLLQPGSKVSDELIQSAFEIFLFDLIICNGDRQRPNSNLLQAHGRLWAIDHELAFERLLIGVKRPWQSGSMDCKGDDTDHALRPWLSCDRIDVAATLSKWQGLVEADVLAYLNELPPEWAAAQDQAHAAIQMILEAVGRIHEVEAEIRRAL